MFQLRIMQPEIESEFEREVRQVLDTLKVNEGEQGSRASYVDYERVLNELDVPSEVLVEVAARLKTAAVFYEDLHTGMLDSMRFSTEMEEFR